MVSATNKWSVEKIRGPTNLMPRLPTQVRPGTVQLLLIEPTPQF